MSSKEAPAETVRRFWEHILNGREYDLVQQMFSEDYVFNGEPETPDQLIAFLKSIDAEYDNVTFGIAELVACDEMVTVRATFSGNWKKTGKVWESWTINLIKVVEGQAVSCWQPAYMPNVGFQ